MDVPSSPCAPDAPCAPGDRGWRLIGSVDDGETIEIVVTSEDLREPDGILIGSDSSSDRSLSEPSVSPRHARLVAHGDGLAVMDLHSATGTAVDGQQLLPDAAPTPLSDGSRLKLGNVTLRVERC